LVPSETDSVSLSLSFKIKNKRRKKEERIRWVAFWVDAHFEMYYGRARVSSSNAHKLFGSAAAVTKSNPPRDLYTAPADV
jgi:hypothetical protein